MPEIPSIGHGSVGPVNRAAGLSPQEVTLKPHEHNGRSAGSDRVELSPHARRLEAQSCILGSCADCGSRRLRCGFLSRLASASPTP